MSVDESENGEENIYNDKIDYNKLTDANKKDRKIGILLKKYMLGENYIMIMEMIILNL